MVEAPDPAWGEGPLWHLWLAQVHKELGSCRCWSCWAVGTGKIVAPREDGPKGQQEMFR